MTEIANHAGSLPLQRTSRWTKYEKALAILFLLTAPVVRPWIHGDGRGYYAFARALLFQHNLDFELDWRRGYESNPLVSDPSFHTKYLTPNGHIWNHWTIGPAILWSPFLLTARAITPLADALWGSHLANDGFSKPYMYAMAVGTLFYGFLTLWISLRLARKYLPERWAFLAVLGIWLASSFAFYLYVEPSFAHTPAAFLTALFVWYWDRTRDIRNWGQWLVLGVIAGLMIDTYYATVWTLTLILFEGLASYWQAWKGNSVGEFRTLFGNHALFATATFLCFLPTLIAKKILWGSYFRTGYREAWYWNSPAFFRVCFSSHGVFSWTPILIPAMIGLFLLRKYDKKLSYGMLVTLVVFIYFIGCFESWHAIPSFGNRFFVSFTIFFVLGLAALFKELGDRLPFRKTAPAIAAFSGLLILWNCGLIYQWAAHLFDQSGEVSWSQVAYNQVAIVPGRVAQLVKTSLEERFGLGASKTSSGIHPPPSRLQSVASRVEKEPP